MPGFATYDDLIAALRAGQDLHFEYRKGAGTSSAGTRWWRLHNSVGAPAAGSNPVAAPGEQYINAAGTISFPDKTPNRKHLVALSGLVNDTTVDAGTRETLLVYDRLAGVGSISLTTATTVVLNSVTVPRYTSGIGVEAWLEVTTSLTGTATVNLSSYTSDSGALHVGASATISTTSASDSVFQLPLQAGDLGVKSVESIKITGAATVGVAAIVLMKPIATLAIMQAHSNSQEYVLRLAALPFIDDGASIDFYYFGQHKENVHQGSLRIVHG